MQIAFINDFNRIIKNDIKFVTTLKKINVVLKVKRTFVALTTEKEIWLKVLQTVFKKYYNLLQVFSKRNFNKLAFYYLKDH